MRRIVLEIRRSQRPIHDPGAAIPVQQPGRGCVLHPHEPVRSEGGWEGEQAARSERVVQRRRAAGRRVEVDEQVAVQVPVRARPGHTQRTGVPRRVQPLDRRGIVVQVQLGVGGDERGAAVHPGAIARIVHLVRRDRRIHVDRANRDQAFVAPDVACDDVGVENRGLAGDDLVDPRRRRRDADRRSQVWRDGVSPADQVVAQAGAICAGAPLDDQGRIGGADRLAGADRRDEAAAVAVTQRGCEG